MAMTNAERQAAYRRRQMQDGEGNGNVQVNVLIDYPTKIMLARLALHYGITEAGLLERLVREEQSRVLCSMTTEQCTAFLDAVQ